MQKRASHRAPTGIPLRTLTWIPRITVLVAFFLGAADGAWSANGVGAGPLPSAAAGRDPRFVPDWRGVEQWPFPLTPGEISNPVLTMNDVTDSTTWFVADPYVFREAGRWYLFFEACATHGRIALATSEDGFDWTFERTVLSVGTHISFPTVFAVGDEHYMVVESGATGCVPLYRAEDFPNQWRPAATLLSGRVFSDPVIFPRDDTWWMFVSDEHNNACFLYYSDALLGPWQEHPQSPVVTGLWRSRAGGPVVQIDGHRLLRVAQEDTPTYGHAVRVFEVDQLTRTAYAEHEIPGSPVLTASGSGWNGVGMHQCCLWWSDGTWRALVDGRGNQSGWAIGCYRGADDASGTPTAGAVAGAGLRVVPNPLRLGEPAAIRLGDGDRAEACALEWFDVSGRLRARSIQLDRLVDPGGVRVAGDEDRRGSASGVYLLRVVDARGRAIGTTRVVVTR